MTLTIRIYLNWLYAYQKKVKNPGNTVAATNLMLVKVTSNYL